MSEFSVEHDAAGGRFFVETDGGRGELVYAERGEDVLDFKHTEVDPSLRGQGVADRLAEAAFDYARERGHRVVPSCPFVAKWVERHPEHRDLLAAPSE